MDVNSIELLKNLFDKCNAGDGDQSSSESENEGGSAFGPGDIKSKNVKKSEIVKTLENPLLKKIDEHASGGAAAVKSLEEWEKSVKEDEELVDTRTQPEYAITYKQSVTTEEIYLQMGLRTPATASCEDMVVEINLPDETATIDQMDLTVEEEGVELKTTVYRLKLALPHRVNPQKGKAEYDSIKKVLKLTLRLNREYDFVNF